MSELWKKTAALVSAPLWLWRAYLYLRPRDVGEVLERLSRPAPPRPDRNPADIAHVSAALRRWARVAPWRSDCLVQAIAGKFWLESLGLPATYRLAADATNGVSAHIWLLSDGQVVTGGSLDMPMTPFRPAGEA